MAASLLLSSTITDAASYYWNVSSGDWSTPAYWGGTEPTSSDYANIQNSGTASITQTGEKCYVLYLGAASTGTVEMSGGDLSVYNSYVGYSGTGTFTQTGGTNSITKYLSLGYNSGASGTYNLSGGTLMANSLYVGQSGTGRFEWFYNGLTTTSMTIGSHGTLAMGFDFDTAALKSGTLFNGSTLTGLSSATLEITNSSKATQSGSTSLSIGYLTVGSSIGNGTYNLSDTAKLSVTNIEYVGFSDTGTFTQTGGTNSVSSLDLGHNSGACGTYNLSGAGQASTSNEYISYSGSGTFTQTDGTNSTSYLYLGVNSGSNGTYDLSDTGKLSANKEYIGQSGTGTFAQIGGTNTATYIKTGTAGTYTLSGGALNINGGLENQGVWDLSNSSAIVNLFSSFLDLRSNILTTANNVTLNIDSHSLLIVPGGYNATDYFANIYNSGIIHQVGSTLDISPAYSIYGIGSIDDHVNCQGTLSATSGYSINLNSGLSLSGTGKVDLGTSGTLCVNNTISRMDGGSLHVSYQYIGSTGTGTFTQTGGTITITDNIKHYPTLALGYNSGSSGTYYLSGTGNLNGVGLTDDGTEYIGLNGMGIFNQTGGINSTYNFYIGYNSGSSGTYNLSGGTNSTFFLFLGYNSDSNGTYNLNGTGYLSAQSEDIGFYGTGTFTQNGGTNILNGGSLIVANGTYILYAGQISTHLEEIGDLSGTGTFTQTGGTNTISTLYLGYDLGSSGTYNLNGGMIILKSLRKGSGHATFNFGGGTLQANQNFTSSLPISLTGDGGNANIDTASYAVTLSGILSGTGGLNKLGTGTLTLSRKETYGGDTTVNGGILAIVGGIDPSGTSLIDVQSGTAVLETVNVNKTNLNINTAPLATFEVVNGTHSVGSISGSGITQVDAGASLSAQSINQGTLTIGSGSIVTILPIPEPSTFVLLSGAFIAAICVWARKRKS